jgi:hypothetical protein
MCPPPDGGGGGADAESKNEKENARLATARFSFARGSVLKKMAVVDAVRGGVVA